MAGPAGRVNGEPTMSRKKTHSGRIATMIVVLVAIAAAAGAGLVFSLNAAPASSQREDTSEFGGEWSPDAKSPDGKLRQIAEFVQTRYLRPGSSKRLTDVSFRQLRVGGKPVKSFVIIHLAAGGQVEQVDASRTAVFSSCGPAPDCSLPGNDTVLGELARRQALELALRALRADDTLDLITVEMPAAAPRLGRVIVFFRRSDLQRALERPLRSTLPLNPPPRDDYSNPVEKNALGTLVVNYAFNSQTRATDTQRAFTLLPAADLQATQAMGG
jgi:hypothetical protein